MVQEITHETFAGQINHVFRIHLSGEPLELELTEVEVNSRPHFQGLRQPFILIFQGPRNRLLPEGFYRAESDAISGLNLYIIPIVSVGDHQAYQVVFN